MIFFTQKLPYLIFLTTLLSNISESRRDMEKGIFYRSNGHHRSKLYVFSRAFFISFFLEIYFYK